MGDEFKPPGKLRKQASWASRAPDPPWPGRWSCSSRRHGRARSKTSSAHSRRRYRHAFRRLKRFFQESTKYTRKRLVEAPWLIARFLQAGPGAVTPPFLLVPQPYSGLPSSVLMSPVKMSLPSLSASCAYHSRVSSGISPWMIAARFRALVTRLATRSARADS